MVVVLVPFGLLIAAVTQQALSLYRRISTGDIDLRAPVEFVERSLPAVTDILGRYGVDIDQVRSSVENTAISISQYVGGQALAIGQNTLTVAVMFGLMLYLLFFFLRDGERIVRGMIRALPMGDAREARLFAKFAEVARATVKGTLVVAIVQGALGGVLFTIAGIGAAVFWGVMMGILSLLPAVGPALIWIPAAVVLFVTGAVWEGILVIAGGAVVVGLVDNILRPILVGRETKMPDYFVLIATLGGLTVFGLSGFVAGPIIAALFLVVWEMFADEYAPADAPGSYPSPPAPAAVPPPPTAPPSESQSGSPEAPASDSES